MRLFDPLVALLQRLKIRPFWLLAVVVMICFIWGNSLVPGTGSSGLSLHILHMARGLLDSWGLPSEWLTNFIVRKTAHFTEYACLGVCLGQAIGIDARATYQRLLVGIAVAVLIPSLDETIQLFVPGRTGQVRDVLIDCSGIACALLLRQCVLWFKGRGVAARTDAQRL